MIYIKLDQVCKCKVFYKGTWNCVDVACPKKNDKANLFLLLSVNDDKKSPFQVF